MIRFRPLLPLVITVLSGQTQPAKIDPGSDLNPPSDAVLLFNGRDMTGWKTTEGAPARCTVDNAAFTCVSGVGNIVSNEVFRDAQIHLEFKIPYMPQYRDQLRGNSGVYLQGRYELQILDSWDNQTYPTGMLGALYGQAPPLVNAARPPGQWQAYDIVFRAPKCEASGRVAQSARVTVHLNRVLIHDNLPVNASNSCEPGPLLLQDHSGFEGAPVTEMQFRNIWLRPLRDAETPVTARPRSR